MLGIASSFNSDFSVKSLKQALDVIYDETNFAQVEMSSEYLGPHFTVDQKNPRKTHFSCPNVFMTPNAAVDWPPPKDIPRELMGPFTLDGFIGYKKNYFLERASGKDRIWDKGYIESLMMEKNTCGHYNTDICARSLTKYHEFVHDKVGVVFGSDAPWAEAALLQEGAAKVLTVEYASITTNHDKVVAFTPKQVADLYLEGQWNQVDFAFSYSSIEHDGLGRYGDAINPYADLESLARIHCLLKPGGLLFLGIPTGPDAIVFNLHRIYGRLRMALVLGNWEAIDLIGFDLDFLNIDHLFIDTHQPIWVLRKPY